MALNKELLQELVNQSEKTIARGKIEEMYLQRKVVGGNKRAEQILGSLQANIKEEEERLDFYREKLKEK